MATSEYLQEYSIDEESLEENFSIMKQYHKSRDYKEALKIADQIEASYYEPVEGRNFSIQLSENVSSKDTKFLQKNKFEFIANDINIQLNLSEYRNFLKRCESDLLIPVFDSFNKNYSQLVERIDILQKLGYKKAPNLVEEKRILLKQRDKLKSDFEKKVLDQEEKLQKKIEKRLEKEGLIELNFGEDDEWYSEGYEYETPENHKIEESNEEENEEDFAIENSFEDVEAYDMMEEPYNGVEDLANILEQEDEQRKNPIVLNPTPGNIIPPTSPPITPAIVSQKAPAMMPPLAPSPEHHSRIPVAKIEPEKTVNDEFSEFDLLPQFDTFSEDVHYESNEFIEFEKDAKEHDFLDEKISKIPKVQEKVKINKRDKINELFSFHNFQEIKNRIKCSEPLAENTCSVFDKLYFRLYTFGEDQYLHLIFFNKYNPESSPKELIHKPYFYYKQLYSQLMGYDTAAESTQEIISKIYPNIEFKGGRVKINKKWTDIKFSAIILKPKKDMEGITKFRFYLKTNLKEINTYLSYLSNKYNTITKTKATFIDNSITQMNFSNQELERKKLYSFSSFVSFLIGGIGMMFGSLVIPAILTANGFILSYLNGRITSKKKQRTLDLIDQNWSGKNCELLSDDLRNKIAANISPEFLKLTKQEWNIKIQNLDKINGNKNKHIKNQGVSDTNSQSIDYKRSNTEVLRKEEMISMFLEED